MKTVSFTKTYDGRSVLDMPAFEFENGRIYAVIGSNGSGKSTMAGILSGVQAADGGVKAVDHNSSCGYMPQRSFAFRMSLKKNLLLNGGDEERAEELMTRLSLTALKDKNAHSLSGGETQRMALARLLMRDYGTLILDEPTASMDLESTLMAEKLIDEYRLRANCAVILITHSLSQCSRLADEVLFFHSGRLAEWGEKSKLFAAPKSAELKRYLEFCNNSG